jgi:hypothetical protein
MVSPTHHPPYARRKLTFRRLILKGREQEALEVMCALSELPEDDPKIQSEFNAVKDTVIEMSKGGFRDCFAMNDNRNLHRTVLAYVNQMFQQISGINIITYYAVNITVYELMVDTRANYCARRRFSRIASVYRHSFRDSSLRVTVPNTFSPRSSPFSPSRSSGGGS